MGGAALTDMVVVVPGILGSVLKRNGKDVWNPQSPGFLGGRLRGVPLDELTLENKLDAVDVLRIPFGLRTLLGSKGYDLLINEVERYFVIEKSSATCSNLHAFPYDWRQDNRESARRLKDFVAVRLEAWRRETSNPEAKVIFLAHSMGGLICRYYLDVLAGAPDCRLLITFGTPHRGAACAIAYLLDGYVVGQTDVGKLMSTFPSVYQLLPRYECCFDGKNWVYPWTMPELVKLNALLLDDARRFHDEIQTAAETRMQSKSYALLPVVGTDQVTIQSAVAGESDYLFNDQMPSKLADLPRFGDGTVPHVSAIPIGYDTGCFVPERHAFLHANDFAIYNACQLVETLQSGQLDKARGFFGTPARTQSALSTCIQASGSDILRVTVSVHHCDLPLGRAVVTVQDAQSGKRHVQQPSKEILTAQPVEIRIDGLAPGLYELVIDSELKPQGSPPAVHELIEMG